MKNITHYKVFISCPSDVNDEREVAEEAIKRFGAIYHKDKVVFDVVHFDKVPSQINNKKPQNVINESLGEYDIYIGIMGARFGSPTDDFGSGTEEEFQIALNRYSENKHPYVSFLFKNIKETPSSIDGLEQLLSVRKFQNSISDKGVFKPFDDNSRLENEVIAILNNFLEINEREIDYNKHQQLTMLPAVPSKDLFKVSQSFYSDFLNNINAEISNGHKTQLMLSDVYVPADLTVTKSKTEYDDDQKSVKTKVSSKTIDSYQNQQSTKMFISGDEASGKTTLAKHIFLNFQSRGLVPVWLSGELIRSSSLENLLKIIDREFERQYRSEALPAYKALDKNKRVLIVDNLDAATITTKHQLLLLSSLEESFDHIFVTVDSFFLFNASVSLNEQYAKVAHFSKYTIEPLGQKLRDEMVRKWYIAGREDTTEDDDIYAAAEKYRGIINSILGNNYVPKRPLVILVLLQAIQGGSERGDLAHSSFVRYYQFLIDQLLLKKAPRDKVDLYYEFLPEVAYGIFLAKNKVIPKIELEKLIENFSDKRDVDKHDLVNIKSHLITLEMIVPDDEGYRFKHGYTYYYFLGQYLKDQIDDPVVKDKIIDMCNSVHLRESSNIIVFLTYHTRDTLVIGSILDKAESIFKGVDTFDFGKTNTFKINQLVAEAPKMILQHDQEKHDRVKALEEEDRVKEEYADDGDLNVQDFGEQIILSFRMIEIIGQLLKNHAYKLESGPKQEMFVKAVNLGLRSLNALVDHFLDVDKLVDFLKTESLDFEDEKEARKVVFALAHVFVAIFLKATADYTGAQMLMKTYQKAVKDKDSKAYKMVGITISMDQFDEFPINELKQVANDYKEDVLAMSVLRSLVRIRLQMRPLSDYQQKQQICSIVGIDLDEQRKIAKESAA